MKKFYLAFVIIAAASIAAGCSKEPTQPTPAAKEKITLTAGASETKTYGIETIRFNAADHLSIFDSEGENNDFALTSTSGASGEFSGEIPAGAPPSLPFIPIMPKQAFPAQTLPRPSVIISGPTIRILFCVT